MIHPDFLSRSWLQAHGLEHQLPAMSDALNQSYRQWHEMLEKPCLYLHDHRDCSYQNLLHQTSLVDFFRSLCTLYDTTRAQLVGASPSQAQKLCRFFLQKTSMVPTKSTKQLLPLSKQALISWTRQHFLVCTRHILHAAQLQHQLRATLHFQVISVHYFKQPQIWAQLSDEWHLRQKALYETYSRQTQRTNRWRQPMLSLKAYHRHLEQKSTIVFGQSLETALRAPISNYQSKPIPPALELLKKVSSSPAFSLQLMSHQQLYNYGRQAIDTLLILQRYQEMILRKQNNLTQMKEATLDLQKKFHITLAKTHLILEAMSLRLTICNEQGLDTCDPILWIHTALKKYNLSLIQSSPTYRHHAHPKTRTTASLAWVKDYYDFIVHFPFEDQVTVTIKAKAIALPIFQYLPLLKKYQPSSTTEKKLLFCPKFWQQVIALKKSLQHPSTIIFENVKSRIIALKKIVNMRQKKASIWEKVWSSTSAIVQDIYNQLDQLLIDSANALHLHNQQGMHEAIAQFYRQLDQWIGSQLDHLVVEQLKPWIFAEFGELKTPNGLIWISTSELASQLAQHIKIDADHLHELFLASKQIIDRHIQKQKQWLRLIQSDWPQQEFIFMPSFIHNELTLTLCRLLNPWSPISTLPNLTKEQKKFFSQVAKQHLWPLIVAKEHPQLKHRDTISKKTSFIRMLLGNHYEKIDQQTNDAQTDSSRHANQINMIASLELTTTNNHEWIIFFLAQHFCLENYSTEKTDYLSDIFNHALEQVSWSHWQPKTIEDFCFLGKEILMRILQNQTKPNLKLHTLSDNIQQNPKQSVLWQCLWICHQMKECWLIFSACSCNEETAKQLEDSLRKIHQDTKMIPDRELVKTLSQATLPFTKTHHSKLSLFSSRPTVKVTKTEEGLEKITKALH